MLFRRVPADLLAESFGRLAVALGAGVDARRATAAETARMPRRWRPAFAAVAAGVAAGEPLGTALARAGDAIPRDIVGMVAVGDRTGRDAETLAAVAATLREAAAARRVLVASLAGPALRALLALVVIGILILLSGTMRDLEGRPVDLLGFGLTGWRGLTVAAACLAALLVILLAALPAMCRSWSGHGPVRRIAERLPALGPALRAAEGVRWCRAASFASAAGIDATGLVSLASRAAPGLEMDPGLVVGRLRAGDTLAEALAAAGRLPQEVIDAVDVGEQSGTVAESLARLVPGLEERARRGYAVAASAAGIAAWLLVAGLVVGVLFRVFGAYLAIIDQAAKPL